MRYIGSLLVLTAALAVFLAGAGCSGDNVLESDKTRLISNRPPELHSVEPDQSSPAGTAGEPVVFVVRASDPDGDPLDFTFSVNDTVRGYDSVFAYTPAVEGSCPVRATVTDGLETIGHEWLLRVSPRVDLVAPATVTVVYVGPGNAPHELEVSWIAVGDDGMDGRPNRYVIGTSAREIETESDWELARHHIVDDPPPAPGTEMGAILSFGGAAEYRVAVVRALDEVDNVSPIGDWVGGYSRGYSNTGVVYDVFTGEPIAGAVIRSGEVTTTTGPDGRWSLEEIPYSHAGLTASDEDVFGSVGEYFDYRIPDSNHQNAFFTAYLLPDIPIESHHFLDFAHFFMGITDMGGLPYHSYLRHWELPIDLYVRPYERDGLDYKATIEDVAQGLSEVLGFTPFNIVQAPVELGVECYFVDGLLKDNYGIREFDDDWYPIWGRIQFRTVYTPGYETAFRRVIAHEFGHVLGMGHSTDSRHLMIGGTSAPQVDTFTPDEIAVIHAIYGIKRGVSEGVFIRD